MEYGYVGQALQEVLDREQAERVAKRLLGPPKLAAGKYMYVHAAEDLVPCEVVTIDATGNASKWSGTGIPSGVITGNLTKGNYGWIQLAS